MLKSPDSLTSLAIAGRKDALRAILRRYDPLLRRFLDTRIRPIHRPIIEVDDILQVTYLEAHLRIGQFTPGGPDAFRSWLTRIAENNLLDAIRGIERHKRPPRDRQIMLSAGDDSYVTLLSLLSGTKMNPSAHLKSEELVSKIEDALGKLPPDYETVIRLSDLQEMAAEEVAMAMKRSRASVYMLKARAHARLAEILGSFSSC